MCELLRWVILFRKIHIKSFNSVSLADKINFTEHMSVKMGESHLVNLRIYLGLSVNRMQDPPIYSRSSSGGCRRHPPPEDRRSYVCRHCTYTDAERLAVDRSQRREGRWDECTRLHCPDASWTVGQQRRTAHARRLRPSYALLSVCIWYDKCRMQ